MEVISQAERSADKENPKCRESYIKGYHAALLKSGNGKKAVSDQGVENPQCPMCFQNEIHVRLVKGYGWVCPKCEAGPFVIHTTGLILKED